MRLMAIKRMGPRSAVKTASGCGAGPGTAGAVPLPNKAPKPRPSADFDIGPEWPTQTPLSMIRCTSNDTSQYAFRLVGPVKSAQSLVRNMEKVTVHAIRSWKNRRFASLTAYDYPLTRLLDEAGIPLILVGDSLGMVVLGYPDTTHVTMAEMIHHVSAAARAKPRALLAADLPYGSYHDPESAVTNARLLIAAGAEAVKAEGGQAIIDQVKAIIQAGIPYLGHIGMLPQSIRCEGRYHIKGKPENEHQALLADAHALHHAGAFGIVLELVIPTVAAEITRTIPIPTIGIGSGPDCDGQILVTQDLIGTFPWFTPRFIKPKLAGAALMRQVIIDWKNAVAAQADAPMP